MSKKRTLNQQTKQESRARRRWHQITLIAGAVSVMVSTATLAGWQPLRRATGLYLPASVALQTGGGQSPTTPSKEYIYVGGKLVATEEGVGGGSDPTPTLPTPTGLVATAISSTQVALTWNASTGATKYQVERRASIAASYTIVASNVTVTAFTDSGLSETTAYLYRVRALNDAGGVSAYSNTDLATTIIFTDDPLVAGVTPIKAQHLSELRQSVNAVHAAAGLAAATWTDPAQAGVLIKAVHITELRMALNQALSALGMPAQSYTDPSLTVGMTVKRAHVEELRSGVK